MKDGSIHRPAWPRAVIFDMDGLMLDTERPLLALWVRAAEKFGWTMDEAAIVRTIGANGPSTKAILLDEYGPDFPYEEICGELSRLAHEEAEREGIPHRPGLLTLLDRLDILEIPLGVATSTSRKTAEWKLERAGILNRFRVLVCGDEVIQSKPAPDIFLEAARKLGAAPEECLGFEDSSAGLRALHAAGIRSVFVKDLVEPPPEVLASVWCRLASLADAAELFE